MDRNNTLLILAALLLLGGGGVLVYNATRELRLNNPGGIEKDGTAWEGMNPDQSADPVLVDFLTPEYGIRALAHNLTSYVTSDGIPATVSAIIARWAPPTENDTAAYIADVAGKLGVDPNATLDLSQFMQPLVTAIIAHENGIQPYSAQTIATGISLA